jgi:hypothetical protein
MKCGQHGCENEATWSYVWHAPMVICDAHLHWMLTIANSMGFPTPRNTLQPLEQAGVEAHSSGEAGNG